MQTHLVVVSVPWRQSSLRRQLGALLTQSWRPDSVTLLLQQYASPPSLPAGLETRTTMRNLQRNTGPAVRWIHGASLPEEDILCVLDDDVVPEPDYFARTLEPIRQGWADATGWYGVTPWWSHLRASMPLPRPMPLRVVAGGACAMRVSHLRGLREHPIAGMCSTVDGGDDLWSSAVLRANGARMVRPAGRAPLHDTEHQNDLRSIRWSRGLDSGKMFFASELI